MATYHFFGRSFHLGRYPATSNRSLRPVSAADELLIESIEDQREAANQVLLQHDRFGALATILAEQQPQFVASFASQEKARRQNLQRNGIIAIPDSISPLDISAPTNYGLMRIPKSLQLFELYLAQFAAMVNQHQLNGSARLAAGFMTRYFSPGLLKISDKYVSTIQQTKARKKARLLLLRNFKTDSPEPGKLVNELNYNGQQYQQYYGVFSADRIDFATQFLLDYLKENALKLTAPFKFLDLACGNGILASEVAKIYPASEGIALDDFTLATSSAIKNLPEERIKVVWEDGLDKIADQSLDLVITNPPFHFGYETNIEVSLKLFHQVRRVLQPGGQLIIVANRHLNYSTHLRQLFGTVETLAATDKFEIIRAAQPK